MFGYEVFVKNEELARGGIHDLADVLYGRLHDLRNTVGLAHGLHNLEELLHALVVVPRLNDALGALTVLLCLALASSRLLH